MLSWNLVVSGSRVTFPSCTSHALHHQISCLEARDHLKILPSSRAFTVVATHTWKKEAPIAHGLGTGRWEASGAVPGMATGGQCVTRLMPVSDGPLQSGGVPLGTGEGTMN